MHHRALFPFALSVTLLPPLAAQETERPAPDPGPVTTVAVTEATRTCSVKVEDADIKSIARQAEANIVISPDVRGMVTLRLHDAPWESALQSVLESLGHTIQRDDSGIYRVQ